MRKEVTYDMDPGPELISPGDVEELIRQGRYSGTYTPPAPYGHMDEDEEGDT